MGGWRAKIGIISVSSDSFEEFVHNRLPEGVSVISTKIPRVHTEDDIKAAFRIYRDTNVDAILYAGYESTEDLLEIISKKGISLPDINILSRRDILEKMVSLNEKILFITPYEKDSELSDYKWAEKETDIIRKNISLYGVVDEGLQLDDATQYWKYHRIRNAICETEDEFDLIYVEDIELAIGDISYQLEGSFGKKVMTTQEILCEGILESCGIGEIRGGDYAKL